MGRYRVRALGVLAVVIASGLAGGLASADPAPDFEHAKQLYRAAEAAMASGHYQEAVTDFGGAYEITKDPVLFYKLGTANQKLGKCDVALGYYGRYLEEAHATEKYVALTRQHIAECNAAAPVQPPPPTNPIEPRPVPVPPVANAG